MAIRSRAANRAEMPPRAPSAVTWARALLVTVILLGSFAGCTPADDPGARFDDYLARLARTLDADKPAAEAPARIRYPAKRDLQLDVETPRTGWIGFFQLHRCGLVNLISERNSILGRVAPPPKRLAYESRLLAGLIKCRARMDNDAPADDDAAFRERLDELIAIKRRAVPRIFWNLTLGSDAVTHLFSVAGPQLGLQAGAQGRKSRQAVARLAAAGNTLADGRPLSAEKLAADYRTLEYSTYGGQLQAAALDAAAALGSATGMLKARMARRPVCFNHRPNRRAHTLQTILLDIYGPNVQSYLADLVRAGAQWRAAVDALIDAQRVTTPPAFVAYRQRALALDRGVWARLNNAIHAHTHAWQTLLGQCGLMPGS